MANMADLVHVAGYPNSVPSSHLVATPTWSPGGRRSHAGCQCHGQACSS